MKRGTIIFIFVIIILIITSILTINQKNQDHNPKQDQNKYTKEQQTKLKKLNNIHEKLDYFNINYLDRYITYFEKNKTNNLEDIITKVNIGLDNPFYTSTKETPYLNKTYLLSNKYISMPSTYIPENLEDIDTSCAKSGMKLVKEAKDSFEALCNQAKLEGYTIRAMSSYRSYDRQEYLYNNYVAQDGKENADTYSARPGFSEHQTGLVVDVDNIKTIYTSFEETKEFNWMQQNAYKYGFILRYPKGKENITGYTYESWHYRYVGKEIAEYIQKNKITFDEYYVKFIENKK